MQGREEEMVGGLDRDWESALRPVRPSGFGADFGIGC